MFSLIPWRGVSFLPHWFLYLPTFPVPPVPGLYRLRTTHSDLLCPVARDRLDAPALMPPMFENGDGVLLNAHSRCPHNGKRIVRSPRFILHDPTGPRTWDGLLALRRLPQPFSSLSTAAVPAHARGASPRFY